METTRAEMTAGGTEKGEAVRILVISVTLPHLFLPRAHASAVIIFIALFCLIPSCNYYFTYRSRKTTGQNRFEKIYL